MKTKLTEKHYTILEKDESGLIPDWVEYVIYHPCRDLDSGQIQFHRREYESIGGPKTGLYNLPNGNDREGWKELHKKQEDLSKKLFPTLTSEEVQKIVGLLESSLVDS